MRWASKTMFIILKRDWVVLDMTRTDPPPFLRPYFTILVGRYEVARIEPPIPKADWFIVLKGTKYGCAEIYWRMFAGEEHGIDQVILEG